MVKGGIRSRDIKTPTGTATALGARPFAVWCPMVMPAM